MKNEKVTEKSFMKLKKDREGVIHNTLTGYDFRIDDALKPLKAIRKKCLECQANQGIEVRNCNITDCPLWPYRMGKRKGIKFKLEPKENKEGEND